MAQSAYVHIPFCRQKCKYCSFVSYTREQMITGYVYSLLKEISENYNGESLRTLYIGGGTPSLISSDLLKKIINKFKLLSNAEITLELNPDDSSGEYISQLKSLGINRLSIGAQTFDDNILQLIGRRHNSEQIINAVKLAQRAGFDNISLDFIYGLPTQTLKGLRDDLNKFLDLGIQHISTYGLKIEDTSTWGKNPPSDLPNDDMQADMYEEINTILAKNNLYRYEISNFAQKGFESNHNLNYWNNSEYYGFGVSAHGYLDGVRYYNPSSLEKYMDNPTAHEYGKFLTVQEKLEEEIFLGFRKTAGINIDMINQSFNIDFETKYKQILDKYNEYFDKTENGYALNLKGIMLSNIILAEFID